MSDLLFDEEHERRITMEILVDAYGPEEQFASWHAYLGSTLRFPFLALEMSNQVASPPRVPDEVEVVDMAPIEDCEHEMCVLITWDDDQFVVPLAGLEPITVDRGTQQAVEDWHYWVGRSYQIQAPFSAED